MMKFEAYEVALQLIRSLRGTIAAIARHDKDLASQLKRALASIALNLPEGLAREGGDRLHLWRCARGSVKESGGCLDVAEALGYVEVPAESLELLDRLRAMCWRLTH